MSRTAEHSDHLVGDDPVAASSQGLADRSDLALIAFERTRMPMVVTDPRQRDNPIVLANAAFLEMSCYSAQEVIGANCRFLNGPGTDPAAVQRVREALEAEDELTIELLNYRKDGSTFWNELFLSPVRDDEGKLLYFFGSCKDVSSRRQARALELEERELLLEIDHRAKNALALVQGFVRLGRADDPAAYSASVQSRVNALARSHSLLATHGWRGVPLMRLVKGEAEPFGGRQVTPSGPEILIGSSQVQPISLFLQEMFSNAARHGALSNPDGEVVVSWQQESEIIVITWQERGGPAPRMQGERSLGSLLIDQIITRQLRGKSSLEWTRDGLKARFSFPLVRNGRRSAESGGPATEPAQATLD